MGLEAIYTPKQIKVLKEAVTADWRMMINHGAKRSGKTVIDNDLFLIELKRVRKAATLADVKTPMYILAGYSSKSIQNNILQELSNKYGFNFKFDKHNSFTLFGVKVVQTFTGSIAGLGAIRGMTAWGAYINEASLANRDVFEEIKDRCSAPGARIICDTNPDNPNHFLKKDYIDNHKPDARIIANHFRLDDNAQFLPADYIASQKAATPSGMLYDRSIEGLWVNGEGVVYADFDERSMVEDHIDLPPDATVYCGVDWGYEHKGSIVVLADDSAGNTMLLEERTTTHEEIDYWVEQAKQVQRKYGRRIPMYADSARPEHVARFDEEGINVFYANKSKLSGIEEVAKLMKTGHFFVSRDGLVDLKNKEHQGFFFDEIYQYIWDEKTGEPVKQNDDVMDAIRYAVYTQHHPSAVVETFKID
ncbi:PBSX family phage terminase large subunit [Lacticaseibacillus saniviri]